MSYILDTQRLLCPLPVIKVQEKVKTLVAGDLLQVICSDPGTLYDIPTWCRLNGHTVIKTEKKDQLIIIEIQVN